MQAKTLLLMAMSGGIGAFLMVSFIAVVLEKRLVYHPDPGYVTPASVGLGDVTEKILNTPDGEKVICWWAKAKPGHPTILYFHGNAGSLAVRAERVRKFNAAGQGMFMMTYRGFGGSTGKPSEAANVADAKLAYDTLVGLGVDPADIIVYGESLGSGVAVQVAASRPIGGIILDAPYTSLVDVAEHRFPLLPSRLLMRDRYETVRYIDKVNAPALILHGELDEIIPVAMGRKVLAGLSGRKEMISFPKANHADHYLFGSFDVVQGWISRRLAARTTSRAG